MGRLNFVMMEFYEVALRRQDILPGCNKPAQSLVTAPCLWGVGATRW
jgi:hypothetical protein